MGLRGERQAEHEVARSEGLGQAELSAAARAHLRAVEIQGLDHEPSVAESPADGGRCRVEAADGGERSLSAPRGTFKVDAPGARGWSRRSELQPRRAAGTPGKRATRDGERWAGREIGIVPGERDGDSRAVHRNGCLPDPAADLGRDPPRKTAPIAQQTREGGRPAHAVGVHDGGAIRPAERHIGEPEAARSEGGAAEDHHRPLGRSGASEEAPRDELGREEECQGHREDGSRDASRERVDSRHGAGLSSTTSTAASKRVGSSTRFRSSTRAAGRGGVPPSSVCRRATT